MLYLRSALFNAWFFGLTFVLGLVGIGVRYLAPERALPLARVWARLVLAGARVICGIRVAVHGMERIPAGAALLASQHQSAFDTLIWAALLPRVSYVYKQELGRIPLFGSMLKASGQIPIARKANVSSVRALLAATLRARAAGRQIVIFPEGTRVLPGAISPIRGGFALIAQRTGLPILPVATNSGHFWGRRAFLKRPGTVQISVGEPIPPDIAGPALLQALQQRWRDAAITLCAVGKSVDFGVNDLTSPEVSGLEKGR